MASDESEESDESDESGESGKPFPATAARERGEGRETESGRDNQREGRLLQQGKLRFPCCTRRGPAL